MKNHVILLILSRCQFFDIESLVFINDFLTLLPFKDKTRRKDLFKTIDNFMTKSNINYDKTVSILTDSTPAIIGKEKIFIKIIKDKNAFSSMNNSSDIHLCQIQYNTEGRKRWFDQVD